MKMNMIMKLAIHYTYMTTATDMIHSHMERQKS